jgi:hypothetical protein
MLGGGGALLAPLAMTKKDTGHHGVRAEAALGDSADTSGHSVAMLCADRRTLPLLNGDRGRSNPERPSQLSRAWRLTLVAR